MQGDELNNAKGVIKLCKGMKLNNVKGVIKLCKGMKLNNVKGVIKLCKGQKSIIRWGPHTVTFHGINCLNKKNFHLQLKNREVW